MISSLLHSCPGLTTYWHMCKCCVTYLLESDTMNINRCHEIETLGSLGLSRYFYSCFAIISTCSHALSSLWLYDAWVKWLLPNNIRLSLTTMTFTMTFTISHHQAVLMRILSPGNDAKLIHCVLGMTLNSFVAVQGMTVKLQPCLRFRACGWGCVRWKAPCRKGCGWYVKLTWLALVGKQPSIPLINLGRKWTLNRWWWWSSSSSSSSFIFKTSIFPR